MERNPREEAYLKAQKALSSLKQMLDKPVQEDRATIDAAIQRFEFTIELFWGLLKRILKSKGVDAVYPKDILRQAYAGNLIDDDESQWLSMLNDRNLTSHTYNIDLADLIFARIKGYYPVLENALTKLSHELAN